MDTFICEYKSPEGVMTAAARDNAVIGLWFNGQRYFPADREYWQVAPDYPVLVDLRNWLDDYFSGNNPKAKDPKISFALAPVGSEFRQTVWKILREIPYGGTSTYGAIAKRIAKQRGEEKFSAQAVGGAVGHNPISILIPCHRVIGTNGDLTGYAGGLDKKQALLAREQSAITGAILTTKQHSAQIIMINLKNFLTKNADALENDYELKITNYE